MTFQPNRMYGELAHLYPLISRPAEYGEEAAYWRDALRSKLGTGRHAILELGAGAGHNLSHLTGDFQVTATDLSAGMLEHCKRLNPGVPTHVGDMRSLRLGCTFKAVLIHDAINYLLTGADLRQTFETAAAHLETGGIVIAAPDRFRETFRPPHVKYYTNADSGMELTVIEYHWDPELGRYGCGSTVPLSDPHRRRITRRAGSPCHGVVSLANMAGHHGGNRLHDRNLPLPGL